jgi:hypothetical protein
MPQIRHHLAAHDALTLTVAITVTDAAHGLRHVRVVDRFGLSLHDAASEQRAEDILLRKIPRPRFPIRVEAKNADGEKVVSQPLYVSPTDTEFEGVKLPRAAIDIHNDREIRRLRNTVQRAEARAVGFRRRDRHLVEHRDALLAHHRMLLSPLMMFVGVATVIAAVGHEPLHALLPALAALAVGALGAMNMKKLRVANEQLDALHQERTTVLQPGAQAAKRLIALGVGDLATSHHCGCAEGAE